MDRADDNELCGRRVDVEEELLAADLDIGALARAKLFFELDAQRILGKIIRLDQALLAALGVRHQNRGTARGALGIEFVQNRELHG